MAGSRNRNRARNARKNSCKVSEQKHQMTSAIDCSSPEALKQAGNEALNAGDVRQASRFYTIGIDLIVAEASPTNEAEWFQADQQCNGILHALLSNRSLAMLKAEDVEASIQDATRCIMASPDFAKGHLRLLAALRANKTPPQVRRAACLQAVRACPTDADLKEAMDKLDEQCTSLAADKATEEAELASQLEYTRQAADDPSNPRHILAAGDIGSALALGAHGMTKDVVEGEKYLKIAAAGGDVASQRNYGMLLLQLNRASEAAEVLSAAAEAGDSAAAETLQQLVGEADSKRKEMMEQLQLRAYQGDRRAVQMLEDLQAGIL